MSYRCVVCNTQGCDQQRQKPGFDYCCLDLPPKYISKKVGKWLCISCADDQVKGASF